MRVLFLKNQRQVLADGAGGGRRDEFLSVPAGHRVVFYGAGGAVVRARRLAERLGVPFLQRATTSSGVPADPSPVLNGWGRKRRSSRLLTGCSPRRCDTGARSAPPGRRPLDHQTRACGSTARKASGGWRPATRGVILGRGAAVVLGKGQGFHVRLDGPADLRVVQGPRSKGHRAGRARRHLEAADRARDAYVRRLYRADPDRDPVLPPGDRLDRDPTRRRHRDHPAGAGGRPGPGAGPGSVAGSGQ